MRESILFAALLAILAPCSARCDDLPWPEILPQVAQSSANFWHFQRPYDEDPAVHVAVGIRVPVVASVKKDLFRWMEAHGVKEAPCGRQIFTPTSEEPDPQPIENCRFLLKPSTVDEAVDWIKRQGTSTSFYRVGKTDYGPQIEDFDKKTRALQREISANREAWKKMPAAASIIGPLWSRLETNRRILVRNAETAELRVYIGPLNR